MKKLLSSLILLAGCVLAAAQPTFYRFSTFDQLVAVTVHGTDAPAIAFVYGDATREDGFGGVFMWDGVSTGITNSFSVFRPTNISASAEGRWFRLAGQYWNQATAADPANQGQYGGYRLNRGDTNVFSIGADNSSVYLQTWGNKDLAINTNGNHIAFGPAGARFLSILSATIALDFPSMPANSVTNLTLTVTGAATNDAVHLALPFGLTAGITAVGFVSAADTVTVRAANPTVNAIDPAIGTFRATVFHY